MNVGRWDYTILFSQTEPPPLQIPGSAPGGPLKIMEGTKGCRWKFCEVLGGAIENVPTFGITHIFSSLYVILINVIDTIQYRNKPGGRRKC